MVAKKSGLIEVRARVNQAVKELKKLEGGLNKTKVKALELAEKGLGKVEEAQKKLIRTNTKLNKVFDRGKNAIKKFRGAIAAFAALGVAVKVMDAITERARELNIVFQNTPFAVGKAQDALGGLVSKFELSKLAIAANRFEVATNEQAFAKLARAGALLARTMGRDARSGVEDLSLALARGSPKILDNLGIILSLGEANRVYAERLGKTVGSLTEAEKKQAFITVGLERADLAARNITSSTDRYANASGRLKTTLVDLADQGFLFLGGAIDGALSSVEMLGVAVGELGGQMAILILDQNIAFASGEVERQIALDEKRIALQSTLTIARQEGAAKAAKELKEETLERRKSNEAAAERGKEMSEEAIANADKLSKERSAAFKKRQAQLKKEAKLIADVTKEIESLFKAQRSVSQAAQEDARRSIADAQGSSVEAAGIRAGIGKTPEQQAFIEHNVQVQALDRERELIEERFEVKRRESDALFELQLVDQERRNALRDNDSESQILNAQREADIFNMRLARQEEAADKQKKIDDELAASREANFKRQGTAAVGAFMAMGEAFRLAGDAGLSGGQAMAAGLSAATEAVLRETAKQAAVKAAFEIAEGLAALAVFNPMAAVHFAAAAKYGVVAAGAGIGARALSSGRASRNQEGLEARSDRERDDKRARRDARDGGGTTDRSSEPVGPVGEEDRGRRRQAQQGAGSSSGGVTVNVQAFGTLPEEDAREMGRQIGRATRSA